MKKSKYAALVLASTLALSTVATTAPQAFGGEGITAQAISVDDEYEAKTVKTDDGKATTTIKVAGVEYELTISTDTATITIGKNKTITAKKDDLIVLNGLNLKVTEVQAAAGEGDPSFKVKVIDQQTAGNVTNMINDLDITAESYAEDVKEAKGAYDLLSTGEATKVKNKSLLDEHAKLAADTEFLKEIGKLPSLETIEGYTEATKDGDKFKSVTEKGKVRVINEDLESAVTALNNFDTAAKSYDKDKKKALDAVIKLAKENLKAAKEQQKIVSGSENLKVFKSAYTALTKGGEFKTSSESIAVKNGKFKIDGDSYVVEEKDGKYVVTGPAGEVTLESDGESFKFQDKDSTSESAFTKNDTYTISKDSNGFAITKAEETFTIPATGIKLLKLDTKMSVNAYKTLKTGSKKYEDSQIEVIKAASVAYKSLDSTSKKKVTKAQVAKLKKYEAALKTQETLEKKLVAEDSKGVTKLISSLKYGKDYATSITAARTAYDGLTPKFQKKVKSSVLAKLKDHEAAITVITAIDSLPSENLLLAKADDTAETATSLAKVEVAIKAITEGKNATTGTYDKLTKSQKSLVKNYKDIAAIEKQIASQKNYLNTTNNKLIADWQTALEKVTKTTDVQTLNNEFAIGTDIYTLSYDKKEKKSTLKKDDTVVEITATGKDTAEKTLTDAAKGNATGTFTVDGANYQLTAAKGKFKVDKLTATEDAPALEVYAFPSGTDISNSETKMYTAEQAKLITDATAAYTAISKVKAAKAFVNKDDVTAYNAYAKALKAQEALEKKDLATAKTLLDKKTVEVDAGKGADTTKILEALKALTNADKNKFIKDLTVDSLAVSDKKLTITVDSVTKFEMTVKEKPSAAEVAAKTAIHDKEVSVAKEKLADKTTVLAAIKELSSENEVLKALTEANVEIASGKATVTLPSGDKAIVTVKETVAP